jgi:hypothetical protein
MAGIPGRLRGKQLIRLKYLLDSLYTPYELAEYIDITRRQIYRVYRPMGMPTYKDSQDRRGYLINGASFREWYQKTYSKTRLSDLECYCLSCKAAVQIVNPEERTSGGITFSISYCPDCGRKISKIRKKLRN